MTTVQTMDPIPQSAPVEQPGTVEQSAAPVQQAQDQAQAAQPEGGQEPAEKQPEQAARKGGVQTRMNELTRARHEAEREAKFWREQAAKQQGAQSSQDAKKPARADFADEEGYFEALALHIADQKVAAYREQSQAERANEAESRHNTTRFELYQQRVSDSAEAMPDYHEVVGKSDVSAAPHVLESIIESDSGPQLAYHLAKNPDVAERLNDMTPLQAAREIGRLEAQLAQPKAETPPQKRTTNAPAPINPVRGGNGQFVKPAEQQTDAEWYASQRK